MPLIEQGFVQYTQGLATLPPFGELLLDKGEVHVKYGYIKSDDYYVIKVASDLTKNQHSYHRGRV
jgi:ornithine cyclodeaminase